LANGRKDWPMTSLFGVKRITLAAADLTSAPPSPAEVEQLRTLLSENKLHPQTQPNYGRLSKAQLLQLVEELDSTMRDTTLRLNIELENTQAEMAALRERLVESVEARLHLEDDLETIRAQRRALHETCDRLEGDLANSKAALERSKSESAQGQKELQRQTESNRDTDAKLSILQAQNRALTEQLTQLTLQTQTLTADCSTKTEDLNSLRTLVDELEQELREERKKQALASLSSDPVTQKAIQQLALVILSKDKEQIADERTRVIVQQIFGTNYSALTEKFEERIKVLETQQRDLLLKYRNSVTAQVALVEELREALEALQQCAEAEDMDALASVLGQVRDLQGRREELEQVAEDLETDEQLTSVSRQLLRQSSWSPTLLPPDVARLRREAEAHRAEASSLRIQLASVKQENLEIWTELDKVRETREEQEHAGRSKWGGVELLTLLQVQAALLEELTGD
jgi:chromosome segregation ATPase